MKENVRYKNGKRALLIGINSYKHSGQIPPLDGCVNDVTLMRSVLVDSFGFPEANVTVLTNEQATRDAILAAFDSLTAATKQDDVVVMHYAGHGSQMTDREGDEPSGFDSTLVPWDSGRAPWENRDITDDEIHVKLEALAAKTSYTTLIVDSCHSGTITRDGFGAKRRSIEADRRPAAELPASPIGPLPRKRSGGSGWLPLADKYVLIAGCRDDEQSAEYSAEGGGKHGALSYFLSQSLVRCTTGTSYRDVFETVSARVTGYNPRQHPQMEGSADRSIFGVTDLAPAPFVPVTSRTQQRVALGAGSAHGLTVGSTYAIYPQGTKSLDEGTALGDVTITTARTFSADAEVTREASPGSIVAGARAFESMHAFSDAKLTVHVAASNSEVTALHELIRASRGLRVCDEPAASAARIYLLPARTQVSASSPVPQAGTFDAPRWAVVGDTGDLLMKLKASGDEKVMVENLEQIATYRRLLSLDNPEATSRLRNRVALEVMRKGEHGWIPAVPEASTGEVVFDEGDAIAYQVSLRGDQLAARPTYVALVALGLSSEVQVLYHKVALLWTDDGPGEFRIDGNIGFPPGYPFTDLSDQAGVGGLITLKLFVTDQEVDFGRLGQSGVRSAGRPSALEDLLGGSAGPATRRLSRTVPEDWATVTRAFVLRRRVTQA